MEGQKKYWCFSCEKECKIIKAIIDEEEIYECSICNKPFVEEIEQRIPSQNNRNRNTMNQSTNGNNINNINLHRNNFLNISPSNSTQNNTSNSFTNQDEYGLNKYFIIFTLNCRLQKNEY